jgi:polyphenol oxidase
LNDATDEPPLWHGRFGVVAGITDRSTGSLGLSIPEPAEDVVTRLRDFRTAMRPAFSALQMAHQVHGREVVWHERVAPGWHVRDDIDGHASAQPGLLLAVIVADCVPIYLTTTDGRAVALLHAGWRGTAANILTAGVELLAARAGASARDIVMHCGVAICGACYEVGEEVARAVRGRRAAAGKQRLDLRAELACQAEALGLIEVTISPLCTSCDRDRFYSHRASGDGGRQIAYLGRPVV